MPQEPINGSQLHETHQQRLASAPFPFWELRLSRKVGPARLVVFVHGFWGKPIRTWREFQHSGKFRDWWLDSDLIFFSYSSYKGHKGASDELRHHIHDFYPVMPDELLVVDGHRIRQRNDEPYKELFLVGHSDGGVVIREALCDAAAEWVQNRLENPAIPRPGILDAKVRLFSPAIGGFIPSGMLGFTKATSFPAFARLFASSKNFVELSRDSVKLLTIERRTTDLVRSVPTEMSALRAHIVWAYPEHVVEVKRYDEDWVDESIPNTTHITVCKPNSDYLTPWIFVESAKIHE